MATKKENLPLTVEYDNDSTGTITYANEVIAVIAGVAANEVDGVAGMCAGSGITDVFGRNKNVTKGVKVELGTEEAAVDVYLMVEYGTPIQTCAAAVQENVRKSIESMTGLHVEKVDLHVVGVSFEKENQEMQLSQNTVLPTDDEDEERVETAPVELVETEKQDDADDEE
jgi:uncharacterized alkaline shock family protein YloU